MPANAQHILLNHEVTPPPGAWETINARLETEFDVQETKVAEKLYDAAFMPPPAAWQNVSLTLATTEANEDTPAKIVRFPFYKIAIAAALLGVVSYLTWSFLSNKKAEDLVQNNQPSSVNPDNNLPDNNPDIAVSPSIPAIDASLTGGRRRVINIVRRMNTNPVFAAAYVTDEQPEETTDMHYAEVNELRAATVTARKGIKAPPIKDAGGNIILDESLVTDGNNNYIIITCPNGEQTRISSKFLPLLKEINGEVDPAEYLGEMIRGDNQWKSRFYQWRAKLMQQASFMPGAGNFLDIMELKDLLEDR
jgi:hypothetical protein